MTFLLRRFGALALLITVAPTVLAWGSEGHATVGILALRHVDTPARVSLEQVLGATGEERVDELCNWPDKIRELPAGEWTAPQHYINIPRHADSYDAQRDCPDGLCVTEALKKYANQLMDDRLSPERRAEAFGWLCHLVGDLHQPLHCGFADDRGGNSVDVEFRGNAINLHQFWDRELIRDRAGSRDTLLAAAEKNMTPPENSCWSPVEVNRWTTDSHQLAVAIAYPQNAVIDRSFATRTWAVILQRIPLAAQRLARILNATVGDGEVILRGEERVCESSVPDV